MRVIPSDEERADWVPGIGGAGLGFGDEESVCDVSEADGLEFLQAGGCTVSAAAHTLASRQQAQQSLTHTLNVPVC